VARYHTRARQPSHWAAAVEIERRHWHGLPVGCSDTIRNRSDERALGHRPNKSRPVTGRRDRTRVAHTPYCEADRNFSASSANANIGATRHGDKQRRRCNWPTSTTPHEPLSLTSAPGDTRRRTSPTTLGITRRAAQQRCRSTSTAGARSTAQKYSNQYDQRHSQPPRKHRNPAHLTTADPAAEISGRRGRGFESRHPDQLQGPVSGQVSSGQGAHAGGTANVVC
jgi:hypothetical protein